MLTSLTRAAAAELAGRDMPLDPRCIGTLHSHAYRALGCPQLTVRHLDAWNRECGRADAWKLTGADAEVDGTAEAVESAVRDGDDHARASGDALLALYNVLRARRTPQHLYPVMLRGFVRRWEAWKRANDLLDFQDLIERALDSVPAAPGNPDVIFLDEAQDTDAAQMALLRRWGRTAGHLVMVGDESQAIYAWRGSDPDAFRDPPLPDRQETVLSQSYRVPEAVRRYAVDWLRRQLGAHFREVEYRARRESADDPASPVAPGVVRRLAGAACTWTQPDGIVDDVERQIAAGRTCMVLATCAHMLVPLLATLRERGVPYHNPFRLKRGDWNPLHHGAARVLAFTQDVDGARWTGRDVRAWAGVLRAKGLFRHGAKRVLTTLPADQTVDIETLMAAFPEGPAGDAARWGVVCQDVEWWLRHVDADHQRSCCYPVAVLRRHGRAALTAPPRVVPGTIHSVKGGECSVAYVLPDLSAPAGQAWGRRGAAAYQELARLFYVAFTRARDELVLCPAARGAAVQWP